MSALAKNYNRRKIAFKKGKGSFLYSTNGKKYLDFIQEYDGSIKFGLIYLSVIFVLLWFCAWILWKRGYKIKS